MRNDERKRIDIIVEGNIIFRLHKYRILSDVNRPISLGMGPVSSLDSVIPKDKIWKVLKCHGGEIITLIISWEATD